jgi:hypothetical protein
LVSTATWVGSLVLAVRVIVIEIGIVIVAELDVEVVAGISTLAVLTGSMFLIVLMVSDRGVVKVGMQGGELDGLWEMLNR